MQTPSCQRGSLRGRTAAHGSPTMQFDQNQVGGIQAQVKLGLQIQQVVTTELTIHYHCICRLPHSAHRAGIPIRNGESGRTESIPRSCALPERSTRALTQKAFGTTRDPPPVVSLHVSLWLSILSIMANGESMDEILGPGEWY